MTYPEWHPLYRREATIKDLLAFEGPEFRVPSRLIQALTELYKEGTLQRPASVRLDESGPERTLFVTLRVSARCLGDMSETDAIYEAIEGATTSKLTVRATLLEQAAPYQRSLILEPAELRDTADLPDNTELDEDEAWLLLTKADLFEEGRKGTNAAIDAWEAQHPQKVQMQYVVVREEEREKYHGLEVSDGATLGHARALAEQLPEQVTVYLTTKDISALEPPYSRSVYETAREMARRLKRGG